MKAYALATAVVAALAVALAASVGAVTIGQVDDFEDGTTQNWVAGGGPFGAVPASPPTNVLGGPTGAADNYLRLTAGGGLGPGSRLTAFSLNQQWSGNYLVVGVGAISMDVRNLGTTDLSLRLLLADPLPGPPANMAFSTVPVLLPAGGGWTHVVFPITAADLTADRGSVAAALADVTELRLYHGAAAGFPGEPIAAQLGVDNITAEAGNAIPGGGGAVIPEPATAALALLGALAGAAGVTRRRPR